MWTYLTFGGRHISASNIFLRLAKRISHRGLDQENGSAVAQWYSA